MRKKRFESKWKFAGYEHPKEQTKAAFTRTVSVTVFVGSTFDLFNVVWKQHHRTALKRISNGAKNGDIDDACKQSLMCMHYQCR